MSLSDAVSGSGLAFYAEVALVLFLIAFVAVLIQVSGSKKKDRYREQSALPLEDGTPPSTHLPESSETLIHGH